MLAFIPARKGSKRLPGKNARFLSGKPLIQYTFEAALKAHKISRVIFSTDSEEMRNIALSIRGIEAPFLRPETLASDTAQASDVHFHMLDWLRDNEGQEPESFCVLLPTSPLRLPEDIDNAIELFNNKQADVVTSVVRTKPLAWHLNLDSLTSQMYPLLDIDTKQAVQNHQELPLPPVYLNGSIYVIRTEPYRRSRSYFGPKTYGYEMPSLRSVDIDDIDDFLLAEAILKNRA